MDTKTGMSSLIKKHWKGIIGFLVIAIILPLAFWLFRIIYEKKGAIYDVSWLGFFGSYLGGVLGGAATLIAVIYTIQNNKDEQIEKENNDKQVSIEKSAFIVYNDFYFNIKCIKNFMNKLWKKRLATHQFEVLINKDKDELENYEYDYFKECCNQFNQFFINSKWISIVANLKDSSKMNQDDIVRICEIYGHFITIQNSIEGVSLEIYKNAYKAMNEIIDFKATLKEGSALVFNEKDEVTDLLTKLKNIAYKEDENSKKNEVGKQ